MSVSSILQSVTTKLHATEFAERRLMTELADAADWLRLHRWNRDVVLFCGAGVSIMPPAAAASFADLRDAVCLAYADLLKARRVIDDEHHCFIEEAVKTLKTRKDISLPPELVFSHMQVAMGSSKFLNLLSRGLGHGRPNPHHHAISELADSQRHRVVGVISPNFDLYIERASAGKLVRRIVSDCIEGDLGFPFFKPHGSLDQSDSIAITLERVVKPLKGVAFETFRDLVAGRMILVIGYSGFDYDLLPLLVHAGQHWNSEIVWVLYDQDSVNQRVASIQLALGDRCAVLNGKRRALLPLLAGVECDASTFQPADLREAFTHLLASESSDALAVGLVGLLTPSGVPKNSGVTARLCSELLRMAETGDIADDEQLQQRLGIVITHSGGDPIIQMQAAELAAAAVLRLGRTVPSHFSRVLDGYSGATGVGAQVQQADQELSELASDAESFPILSAALRAKKAELMLEGGRDEEASMLVRTVLKDTRFPDHKTSPDAWTTVDRHQKWRLLKVLTHAALKRNAIEEGLECCAEAFEGYWDDADLIGISEAAKLMAQAASRLRSGVELANVAGMLSRHVNTYALWSMGLKLHSRERRR